MFKISLTAFPKRYRTRWSLPIALFSLAFGLTRVAISPSEAGQVCYAEGFSVTQRMVSHHRGVPEGMLLNSYRFNRYRAILLERALNRNAMQWITYG